LAATAAVVVTLLLAFVYLPLPFHVKCQLEVQPHGATPVFSRMPGTMVELTKKPGMAVKAGEILARLQNTDLLLEIARLEGELKSLEAELKGLEKLQSADSSGAAGQRIKAIQEIFQTTHEQLEERKHDLGRLTIIAPTDGYVFPATPRPKRDLGDGRLPQWSGSPFDPKNQGAFLTGSDQLCQIGKSTDYEAVLVVDQSDVDLVERYFNEHRKYPTVRIKLDAFRWKTVDGEIERLASAPMESTPASLSTQGGGTLETKTDRKTGATKTISTSYQARVRLNDDRELLRVGLTGKAKVYTGWQSLYERTARYVRRTFHFDW